MQGNKFRNKSLQWKKKKKPSGGTCPKKKKGCQSGRRFK